jgi:hypothetical protein
MGDTSNAVYRGPWNKGKIVGQKAIFGLKDIWALRAHLQMESRLREPPLFNLGIDRKLRSCHLGSLKLRDICHGDQVASRSMVMRHKTQRPIQLGIAPATLETRAATAAATPRPGHRNSPQPGFAGWQAPTQSE